MENIIFVFTAVENNNVILRCGKYAREQPKTTTASTTVSTTTTTTTTTPRPTTTSTTTTTTERQPQTVKEVEPRKVDNRPGLGDIIGKAPQTFRDKFSKVGKGEEVAEPSNALNGDSSNPWGSTDTQSPWFIPPRKEPGVPSTSAPMKAYRPPPIQNVYPESKTYRPPPIEELMKNIENQQRTFKPPPVEELFATFGPPQPAVEDPIKETEVMEPEEMEPIPPVEVYNPPPPPPREIQPPAMGFEPPAVEDVYRNELKPIDSLPLEELEEILPKYSPERSPLVPVPHSELKEVVDNFYMGDSTTMDVPMVTEPVNPVLPSQDTTITHVVYNAAEPTISPWERQAAAKESEAVTEARPEEAAIEVEEAPEVGFPGVPVSSYDGGWGMWGMPGDPNEGPTDNMANHIANYASNYYNYDDYYNDYEREQTIPQETSSITTTTTTTTARPIEGGGFCGDQERGG